MIPPNSFRLHLILGEEERHATKQRCGWWMGCFPTSPKRKPHAPGKEKMCTCLSNKTKQMETLEEDKDRKEHRYKVDKYTLPSLFFPIKSHFHTVLKWKHSDAGKSTWRGFFNNVSPCHRCQLVLVSRRLSLWAEQRRMFLPSRYHLNIWAFKK